MNACANGHGDVAALLLKRGANMDKADHDGRTALIYACRNGQRDVAALLLERGADVNMAGSDGQTALVYACRNGHRDVAELLLERGADVEKSDSDGWTALMHACLNGHHDVAALLLKRGADVKKANSNGTTALMYARDQGHTNILELLEAAATKATTATATTAATPAASTAQTTPTNSSNGDTADAKTPDEPQEPNGAGGPSDEDQPPPAKRVKIKTEAPRPPLHTRRQLVDIVERTRPRNTKGINEFNLLDNCCAVSIQILLTLRGGKVADCPKRHGLVKGLATMEGFAGSSWSPWECDVCERVIEDGATTYGCRKCRKPGYDICAACYGKLDVMRPDSHETFPLDEFLDNVNAKDGAEEKEDDTGAPRRKIVVSMALFMGGSASSAMVPMLPHTTTMVPADGAGNGTADDPYTIQPYVIHLDGKSYHTVWTQAVSAIDLVTRLEGLGCSGAFGIIHLNDIDHDDDDDDDGKEVEAMGHTLNFYHTNRGVYFIDAKLLDQADRVIEAAQFQKHLDGIYKRPEASGGFACQTRPFYYIICGGVPLESVVTTTGAKPKAQDVKTEPDEPRLA